jgi:hypothetical protein
MLLERVNGPPYWVGHGEGSSVLNIECSSALLGNYVAANRNTGVGGGVYAT